jgi:acyl-coenzyme A synthetase/AMP-(fatty) acid ligase
LPKRRYMLNLCVDRYHFTVGFCAALLQRQVTLLPPHHQPILLRQLGEEYPGAYCLTEPDHEPGPLEIFAFPPLSRRVAEPPTVPAVPTLQTAAIVFTSGSTGQPVANEKSWGALVKGAESELQRMELRAFPGLSVIGTVPPQHMYGLESTVLMPMQGGLALHSGKPFFPADIIAALAAMPRPRGLVTTPVHLRALLAETRHAPPVDFLLCATAPLPPQLATAAQACFGATVHEIYGCTEAGQVASRRTVESPAWSPLPGVTLRQDDGGTWVSGGHVELEVLLHDVIERQGDGTFLLHGRTSDLVNVAGKRSSIANLNYHLNSIAGVLDGAFIMPEEAAGAVTRLVAFVVAPRLTRETVMSALRKRIDTAFLPRPLCFVDALPRNDTGKLPREALRDLMARTVGGES